MDRLLKVFVWGREEIGQSMTEYALIMAAIAVVAIVAYQTLGNNVCSLTTNVASKL